MSAAASVDSLAWSRDDDYRSLSGTECSLGSALDSDYSTKCKLRDRDERKAQQVQRRGDAEVMAEGKAAFAHLRNVLGDIRNQVEAEGSTTQERAERLGGIVDYLDSGKCTPKDVGTEQVEIQGALNAALDVRRLSRPAIRPSGGSTPFSGAQTPKHRQFSTQASVVCSEIDVWTPESKMRAAHSGQLGTDTPPWMGELARSFGQELSVMLEDRKREARLSYDLKKITARAQSPPALERIDVRIQDLRPANSSRRIVIEKPPNPGRRPAEPEYDLQIEDLEPRSPQKQKKTEKPPEQETTSHYHTELDSLEAKIARLEISHKHQSDKVEHLQTRVVTLEALLDEKTHEVSQLRSMDKGLPPLVESLGRKIARLEAHQKSQPDASSDDLRVRIEELEELLKRKADEHGLKNLENKLTKSFNSKIARVDAHPKSQPDASSDDLRARIEEFEELLKLKADERELKILENGLIESFNSKIARVEADQKSQADLPNTRIEELRDLLSHKADDSKLKNVENELFKINSKIARVEADQKGQPDTQPDDLRARMEEVEHRLARAEADQKSQPDLPDTRIEELRDLLKHKADDRELKNVANELYKINTKMARVEADQKGQPGTQPDDLRARMEEVEHRLARAEADQKSQRDLPDTRIEELRDLLKHKADDRELKNVANELNTKMARVEADTQPDDLRARMEEVEHCLKLKADERELKNLENGLSKINNKIVRVEAAQKLQPDLPSDTRIDELRDLLKHKADDRELKKVESELHKINTKIARVEADQKWQPDTQPDDLRARVEEVEHRLKLKADERALKNLESGLTKISSKIARVEADQKSQPDLPSDTRIEELRDLLKHKADERELKNVENGLYKLSSKISRLEADQKSQPDTWPDEFRAQIETQLRQKVNEPDLRKLESSVKQLSAHVARQLGPQVAKHEKKLGELAEQHAAQAAKAHAETRDVQKQITPLMDKIVGVEQTLGHKFRVEAEQIERRLIAFEEKDIVALRRDSDENNTSIQKVFDGLVSLTHDHRDVTRKVLDLEAALGAVRSVTELANEVLALRADTHTVSTNVDALTIYIQNFQTEVDATHRTHQQQFRDLSDGQLLMGYMRHHIRQYVTEFLGETAEIIQLQSGAKRLEDTLQQKFQTTLEEKVSQLKSAHQLLASRLDDTATLWKLLQPQLQQYVADVVRMDGERMGIGGLQTAVVQLRTKQTSLKEDVAAFQAKHEIFTRDAYAGIHKNQETMVSVSKTLTSTKEAIRSIESRIAEKCTKELNVWATSVATQLNALKAKQHDLDTKVFRQSRGPAVDIETQSRTSQRIDAVNTEINMLKDRTNILTAGVETLKGEIKGLAQIQTNHQTQERKGDRENAKYPRGSAVDKLRYFQSEDDRSIFTGTEDSFGSGYVPNDRELAHLRREVEERLRTCTLEKLMFHIPTRDEVKKMIVTHAPATDRKVGETLRKIQKEVAEFSIFRANAPPVNPDSLLVAIKPSVKQYVSEVLGQDQELMDLRNIPRHLEDKLRSEFKATMEDHMRHMGAQAPHPDDHLSCSPAPFGNYRPSFAPRNRDDELKKLTRDFDNKLYEVACQVANVSVPKPMASSGFSYWVWNSGSLKADNFIPWEYEAQNNDTGNLAFKETDPTIRIRDAGLYQFAFGFFGGRTQPTVQLFVNNDSVMSSIHSPSYSVHIPAGRKNENGRSTPAVTGLTLQDFLSLGPKTLIKLRMEGSNPGRAGIGHGFLALRRL